MSEAHAPHWERLHPASFLLSALRALPQALLGLVGASWALTREGMTMLLVAAGAALVALLIGYVGWRRFRFAITDDELRIESGVLSRRRRVIPLSRIADIDIERGPLHRLLGLARVRVETGGSDNDEGSLDSVSLARAAALRDRLRGHAAADRAPDSVTIFTMTLPRLLLTGAANFSLVYLAVVFSVLQQFGPAIGFSWRRWVRETGLRERVEGFATVEGVLFVAGVALLLGVVTGIVRTMLSDWGFTLRRRDRSLVRKRGLMTITEVALALRRVQAVHVVASPLARLFGFARLQFQMLGGAGGKDDRTSSGLDVVVPLGTRDEIERVAAHALAFALPPGKAYLRGPIRAVVPPLILATLVAIPLASTAVLTSRGWAVWLVAIGFALVLARLWLGWRGHGLIVDDALLFVRRGAPTRTISALRYSRIQALIIRRGPIDRLLGLARVQIDSAGAPRLRTLAAPRLGVDAAQALVGDLLARRVNRAATR